jgi:hypothetical protein
MSKQNYEYFIMKLRFYSISNTPSPWSSIRLHNGNTLISGDGQGYTREVNMKGETVWDFTRADTPFIIGNTQTANLRFMARFLWVLRENPGYY